MGSAARDDDPFLFTLALKPVDSAVKEARDLIAFAWRQWGLGDDTDARLVVSELAANAVRASRADQRVVVRCYVGSLGLPIIEVGDQSPEPIIMEAAGPMDIAGRGLFIVAQLVQSWEVLPLNDGGKLIRVEMPDGWPDRRPVRKS